MFSEFPKKISSIESIILIVVVTLIIAFATMLTRNIQTARHAGVFAHRPPVSELLLKNKQSGTVSVSDVESIDVWMTFQYINFIFNIPEDHLKSALHIEDSHYPNLSVGRYIKNKQLNKAEFVASIKNTVRAYMTSHPKP